MAARTHTHQYLRLYRLQSSCTYGTVLPFSLCQVCPLLIGLLRPNHIHCCTTKYNSKQVHVQTDITTEREAYRQKVVSKRKIQPEDGDEQVDAGRD